MVVEGVARVADRPQPGIDFMNRIASRRPGPGELTKPYHIDMVGRVAGQCALRVLDDQLYWLCELASHLSTEQVDRIHAPYGWTIRQVLEHCANAERVFGYRMLRLAAGDATALPGWDENAYADARFGLGSFTNLVNEMAWLRMSNVGLLRRIKPGSWDHQAEVDGTIMNVRSIAWVAAAHVEHHFAIIEKRAHLAVQRAPESAADRTG